MDLAAVLEPVLAFFRDGIGKVIADVFTFIYQLLYPANAESAKPVEIPR